MSTPTNKECCEICLRNGKNGYKPCPSCSPTQPESSWETRLRDLYLTTTPDEEGLYTASISFNWGKFTFEPKDKSVCEFYLATKDSIESFLRSEIEAAEERGHKKIGENNPKTGDHLTPREVYLFEKGIEQGRRDALESCGCKRCTDVLALDNDR